MLPGPLPGAIGLVEGLFTPIGTGLVSGAALPREPTVPPAGIVVGVVVVANPSIKL